MLKRKQKTLDGNSAVAHVAYAFSEVAAIFPITPSSPMAEMVDLWSANDKKNIFGQPVKVVEMQSEAGAAGAVHGSLQGGALTTTFTSSQGLLLMIPNMYNIAGELLPGVFHVAARAVGTNAKSIFCDHQDVMSTRQTGFAMLASSSVQDTMNLAAVAHLSAIKGRIPFLHFFDGFRTSHEIQKIDILEYDELKSLIDREALSAFRHRALNPDHPDLRSVVINPDALFQLRESINPFYDALVDIVAGYMEKINELTGKDYKPFNYYGAPDAEYIIIAMGSGCETVEETVRDLNERGEKVGVVNVRLFRPFSADYFLRVIPETVKKVAVLDRSKEPGAPGEVLLADVKSVFYTSDLSPVIVGGRFGLGSKEFLPKEVAAVFENLKKEKPKDHFTVGINDDVTFTSLPEVDFRLKGSSVVSLKFWGYGSDGTVGANKTAVKIVGDTTSKYVQAYFSYDTKKSGGLTVSHLRFSDDPIQSAYLVYDSDFIACHKQSYLDKYDLLEGLKKGGTFLLNCMWSEKELEENLPDELKRYIARNDIGFYIIDAEKIANEIGLHGRINMIMQAAFFRLTDLIPYKEAIAHLRESVKDSYGNQGQEIIDMNYAAIDAGAKGLIRVAVSDGWRNLPKQAPAIQGEMPAFVKDILIPMNSQKGDSLPVSAFLGYEDGSFPSGTTKWEKRGASNFVVHWNKDKCIQCNQCSFVCSHAVLRPILLSRDEIKKAPENLPVLDAAGYAGQKYHLAVSVQDCTGCSNCADTCPKGALSMEPLAKVAEEQTRFWDYTSGLPEKEIADSAKFTVKGSQFVKPLLEFSGACAGCVQTVYAKLITQLYGDRMMIANPAGCTGAWASAAPSFSYAKNDKGRGPAWASSLFEDNAEYGYGMLLGVRQVRENLAAKMLEALTLPIGENLKEALSDWIENRNESRDTVRRADRLQALLENQTEPLLKEIYGMKDYFIKRSVWLFGGDGWAYDIGFGGLDHILASGEDINAFVFDTQVYSNTGGQASKATPTAAIAQFAAGGKKMARKDLGLMAMSYGHVYVAQISIGADKAHTLREIAKAEAYPGPSLIIAYCPCLNHGIREGMSRSIRQSRLAVECGLWPLYHFDPQKIGKENPFTIDYKNRKDTFIDFLHSEVRFDSLRRLFPDKADAFYQKAKADAASRFELYERMEKMFK